MSIPFILLPFFTEVVLIFALLLVSGGLRGESGKPRTGDLVEDEFRLPLLFLVLAPLAILTRKADYPFVILAWIFVILRWAHAGAHVAAERGSMRSFLFAASAIALLAMWILFAAQILLLF